MSSRNSDLSEERKELAESNSAENTSESDRLIRNLTSNTMSDGIQPPGIMPSRKLERGEEEAKSILPLKYNSNKSTKTVT